MLHIILKGIRNAATWLQTIFTCIPQGIGFKRSKSTFSEHGHVANQIKGNHECSNIVANIWPAETPSIVGMGSMGQKSHFLEHGHVTYQITGNHEIQQHVAT